MARETEETMGERMKRLREAAGMSQPQLARKADIPLPTLRNFEQDRRIPRLDVAARLAKAIGCNLEDLAGPVDLPKVKEQPPKKRGRPRKHNQED
jgi:transcriptional regulator with XRE-family HTH domain